MDRRNLDRGEDPRRIGRDELLVVGPRERADPGVEELDDVGAGRDLARRYRDRSLGQLLHEPVPDLGRAVHAALGLHEVAGRLPLDEIAGDGERPSAEADERLLRLELRTNEPHGLEDERHRLLRVGHAQRLDVGGAPNGLVDHGADVLDELDVDAHAEDRQHDVREHDRGIDAVHADGLERDLGAELGLTADLEQAVALADLTVAGQRAPRLAHEPDRSPLDRLQARGSDEEGRRHPEMGGELVVDPPEDERRDRERDESGDDDVHDIAGLRKPPEEERVANRQDEGGHGISVVDEIDECRVVADPRQVERVEDRRQEEPRQKHRRQQMLDVAEDDRHRGEDEREAAGQRDERQHEWNPGPERRSRLGKEDQVHRDDDREHHEQRDGVRRDDREREQLPGEAHLLDEARLAEQARARALNRPLEEHPGHEPGEQEERVVVDIDGLQQHREDDRVDAHQDERQDERPAEPEHGAAVLHAQLPAKEVEEEIAVTEEVGVERHGRSV